MSRVAVVGGGAIGGVLAQAADAAGHEVTLCVRTPVDRLVVGDHQVPVLIAGSPSDVGSVDWVIVATKAHHDVSAWLAQLAGPVVLVRNGVDHAAGSDVVPALAYIAARRVAPWHVVHTAGDLLIVPSGPAGNRFAALLDGGPVRVSLSEDFLTDAWRKLLTNVAANPITALTARPVGVMAAPGMPWLVRGLLEEAVRAGVAAGARLSERDVAATLEFYGRFGADDVTSMLEDRRAGRPTEHEAITGAVVRAADRYGLDVPLNRAVLALLDATSAPAPAAAPGTPSMGHRWGWGASDGPSTAL
jgi:2-dehydropantoate 2-reductase